MSEQSRVDQFLAMFSEAGITPVVFDPNNAADNERGMKEIAERISEAVDQIRTTDDKPKA